MRGRLRPHRGQKVQDPSRSHTALGSSSGLLVFRLGGTSAVTLKLKSYSSTQVVWMPSVELGAAASEPAEGPLAISFDHCTCRQRRSVVRGTATFVSLAGACSCTILDKIGDAVPDVMAWTTSCCCWGGMAPRQLLHEGLRVNANVGGLVPIAPIKR